MWVMPTTTGRMAITLLIIIMEIAITSIKTLIKDRISKIKGNFILRKAGINRTMMEHTIKHLIHSKTKNTHLINTNKYSTRKKTKDSLKPTQIMINNIKIMIWINKDKEINSLSKRDQKIILKVSRKIWIISQTEGANINQNNNGFHRTINERKGIPEPWGYVLLFSFCLFC